VRPGRDSDHSPPSSAEVLEELSYTFTPSGPQSGLLRGYLYLLLNTLNTALQAGRSQVRFPMVSLDFFIDIILPGALWPWGLLSL
jgi:hypothetical protein